MPIIYLALGANLGNRREYIDNAVSLLKENRIKPLALSRIIETDAVGGPIQGKYLNAVLKAQTDLSPEDLHRITASIERRLGRIREIKNGPRVIDIDILLYGDIKLVSKTLLIPHPRMLERDFVMGPLKEIDPKLCASLKV